jgi:hypothetical protein
MSLIAQFEQQDGRSILKILKDYYLPNKYILVGRGLPPALLMPGVSVYDPRGERHGNT